MPQNGAMTRLPPPALPLPPRLAAELDLLGLPGGGFAPPAPVIATAAQGLALRARHGRGGTEVGLRRAEGLAAARPVSAAEMRVMAGWFARFAYLHGRSGWGDLQRPSTGWIAWQLWGGDAGRAWVEDQRRAWADHSQPMPSRSRSR